MKNIIKIEKRQGLALSQSKGFTLLEILLVVAAIGILAGIVILAINPGKQLGDTRNAQRRVDINTILNSVYQYSLDNNGNFPAGIDSLPATSQVLGTDATGCDTICPPATATTTLASCANLASSLTPNYIVDIPRDPKTGSSTNSGYYINKRADGRLTVGVCNPEGNPVPTLNITR